MQFVHVWISNKNSSQGEGNRDHLPDKTQIIRLLSRCNFNSSSCAFWMRKCFLTVLHDNNAYKMTIFMINALSWSQFMLKWTNLEPSIFSIFLHSSPFDNTELSLLSIPILPGPDLYSEPWKIMWTNGGPCFRLSNVQSWWLLFVLNIKLY